MFFVYTAHACSCYIRRFGIPCWAIWLICFFFARASSAFTPPNESAKVRCYSWVDMLPLLRPPWFSLRITCGTWDTSDTVFQISAQKQSTKSVIMFVGIWATTQITSCYAKRTAFYTESRAVLNPSVPVRFLHPGRLGEKPCASDRRMLRSKAKFHPVQVETTKNKLKQLCCFGLGAILYLNLILQNDHSKLSRHWIPLRCGYKMHAIHAIPSYHCLSWRESVDENFQHDFRPGSCAMFFCNKKWSPCLSCIYWFLITTTTQLQWLVIWDHQCS